MIEEADIDDDSHINFLEFHKVIKKFYKGVEQYDLDPPKPPDGGWGWVIVFSCFMCNFIVSK